MQTRRWILLLSALHGLVLPCAGGRWRRHLDQLGAMIGCRSGHAWVDYVDYGCYCGLGGHGDPLDNVDRCCRQHDRCYGGLGSGGFCRWFHSPYWTSYTWRCRHHTPQCYDADNTCARSICTCDKQLVDCLSRSTFHPHLVGINKDVMCRS
ncbi:basic phospholipase A2 acanthin-1-like [Leucoraja erinacea]|uniref:basic phospholipase A2 acanthin-1-like n=1 Tax=Leucoraja erinaceus TaxID=7782 RepID=UPI00245619DD|nr:basic phospholipase A2 acanthin-1-like [Leucoraja erinacea]